MGAKTGQQTAQLLNCLVTIYFLVKFAFVLMFCVLQYTQVCCVAVKWPASSGDPWRGACWGAAAANK